MKIWFLIGAILTTSGCNANDASTDFEGLKIPQKYVLHAPSEGPKGVFDDQDTDIALVISEDEIKTFLPQYQIAMRGSRELSFVLKNRAIDLNAISDSILTSFNQNISELKADSYLPYERLYRTSGSWLLVSSRDGNMLLEAQCRRSGLAHDIEVCDFNRNINGYGVSFHLEDSNITLVKEFEDFLSTKIDSWRN